jgi:hypothetical protein
MVAGPAQQQIPVENSCRHGQIFNYVDTSRGGVAANLVGLENIVVAITLRGGFRSFSAVRTSASSVAAIHKQLPGPDARSPNILSIRSSEPSALVISFINITDNDIRLT